MQLVTTALLFVTNYRINTRQDSVVATKTKKLRKRREKNMAIVGLIDRSFAPNDFYK